jgi:hypothetical protein
MNNLCLYNATKHVIEAKYTKLFKTSFDGICFQLKDWTHA